MYMNNNRVLYIIIAVLAVGVIISFRLGAKSGFESGAMTGSASMYDAIYGTADPLIYPPTTGAVMDPIYPPADPMIYPPEYTNINPIYPPADPIYPPTDPFIYPPY